VVLFFLLATTTHASWLRPSPTYEKARRYDQEQKDERCAKIARDEIASFSNQIPVMVQAWWIAKIEKRMEQLDLALKLGGGVGAGGIGTTILAWFLAGRRERKKNGVPHIPEELVKEMMAYMAEKKKERTHES